MKMSRNVKRVKDRKWIQLILQFPVTRILVALFMIAAAVQGFQSISKWFFQTITSGQQVPIYSSFLIWGLSIPVAFFAYYIFSKFYEKREIAELQHKDVWKEIGLGAATGSGLMVSILLIIWALGSYRIVGFNGFTLLALPLFHYAYTAVYEELIFRGILYRIIEKSLGSWIALVISGLIFGFAHASVPNATLYSNLAIGILGGVIFSSAYMYTRRLWFAIGIHFAWNFTLVGIFGIEVSEKDGTVLLESELAQTGLISGGELGLETSVVTFAVVLVAGFYLLWRSFERGHFVKPFWQRK